MEFRLVYEGPLRAAGSGKLGTRAVDKHQIRKTLHKQIKRLWQAMPHLKMRTDEHSILSAPPQVRISGSTGEPNLMQLSKGSLTTTMAAAIAQPSLLETLGNKFDKCGYKFVPLVSSHLKLCCGLDILFLRRDMPGTPLIRSGGDIDNRLKVLFDALRIPADCGELPGAMKDADEDPYFFCLMEDDALITDVAVTTDTLLTPCNIGDENNVHLVIKVKVRPTDFSFENLAFSI